jgi:hypothetical protein
MITKAESFDPSQSEFWTLPMVAAWFIWRDYDAVFDQWRLEKGHWTPVRHLPPFLLKAPEYALGTLKSIFTESGFDKDPRWDNRKTGPFVEEIDGSETESPWERLKYALQSGSLIANLCRTNSTTLLDRHRLCPDDWGPTEHLGTHQRALYDPQAPDYFAYWTGVAEESILISREQAIQTERRISKDEYRNPIFGIKQAVGWIAYRSEDGFRSLGRADMEPLGYLDRSYAPDYPNRRPDEALFSLLASGKIKAYLKAGGEEFTRDMLLSSKSLWDAVGVVFLRDELVKVCAEGKAKDLAPTSSTSEDSRPQGLVALANAPGVFSASAKLQKSRGPRPTLRGEAIQTLIAFIKDGTHTLQSLKDMRQKDLMRLCKVESRDTACKALAEVAAIVANSNVDK